ncbi:MAG: hypothetical protein KAJ14_12785, partial [Candidatus Omnitrophica bacterium]|nr:hypothetical protein [Candidatus Omnitrophota bacterium]
MIIHVKPPIFITLIINFVNPDLHAMVLDFLEKIGFARANTSWEATIRPLANLSKNARIRRGSLPPATVRS